MGIPTNPSPVCLICAVTYNAQSLLDKVRNALQSRFGETVHESPTFGFDFTDYYESEMGAALEKLFLSFERLIPPEQLVSAKLATNELEKDISTNGRRNVNIDPGYVECSKLVLATTKDYGHRVYLGQGIYGDVHLRFRGGAFRPNEWTYPDYRQHLTIDFFTKVRDWYMKKLAASRRIGDG